MALTTINLPLSVTRKEARQVVRVIREACSGIRTKEPSGTD